MGGKQTLTREDWFSKGREALCPDPSGCMHVNENLAELPLWSRVRSWRIGLRLMNAYLGPCWNEEWHAAERKLNCALPLQLSRLHATWANDGLVWIKLGHRPNVNWQLEKWATFSKTTQLEQVLFN